MTNITGLMEMLWSAKEGLLVQAEVDLLKSMGLIEELRGYKQGSTLYILTVEGEKILLGLRKPHLAAAA